MLRPSGQAVFIDTIAPADPVLDTHLQAIELLRDGSHVRNYSRAEWIAALAHAGFAARDLQCRRLAMEFPAWTRRTHTPELRGAAIRSVQDAAPGRVRDHFEVLADGSFSIDTMTVTVVPG